MASFLLCRNLSSGFLQEFGVRGTVLATKRALYVGKSGER